MPDYKTAYAAIQNYFNTQWAGATEILFDDDARDIPDDTAWVRLTIRHTDGAQSTMGSPSNNRFRRHGLVFVQLFTPQGTNYDASYRTLVKNALDIFSGTTDSGIYYYNSSVREIGNDGRGWFQVNVVTEFRYDEIT